MKLSQAFPSNYLRAADLDGREPTLTIAEVITENIGDERKLVVKFVGKDKGLVLNKTNANSIAEITGAEDTDDWTGHKVKLFTAKVEYQGKRVPAIRIDAPAGKPSRVVEEPVEAPDDDSIPFSWAFWLLPVSMMLLPFAKA